MVIRKPKIFYLKTIIKHFQNGLEVDFNNIDPDYYWYRRVYNQNGNQIRLETSDGFWGKSEYDNNNNEIYYENSDAVWYKYEYDENGNLIYQEDSDGYIGL